MRKGLIAARQGASRSIQGLLGNALQYHRAGQLTEAERIYGQILKIDSHHADTLHLLGMVAYQAGRHEEAVEMIRRAIAIHEQGASYHSNLGIVLQAQGKLDEAAACYQRALALRPDLAEIHTNLGNILHAQGKLDEAVACHERALALKPGLPEARYNLGLAQLLSGSFNPGWHNFEGRWRSKDFATPMRVYPKPLWTGESLTSGRLMIWGEQGIGDEIMFAGLIPDVLRTGSQCMLDCDKRLRALFARSFPEVEVIASRAEAVPAPSDAKGDSRIEFAAHIPSGSLPRLFRSNESAFAATTSPYLIADADQRKWFRTRYADGRRLIGLAWHTNNRKTGSI